MGWIVIAVIVVAAVVAAAAVTLRRPAPEVKNPGVIIEATIGDIESLDPAWAYDTASAEAIYTVYETLIFFKGEKTDEFEPKLATDWKISEDGLTYTFTIRKGVKFHNGNSLTPEDVEYSFERAMVQDRSGGPVWMLLEPLLDVHSTRDDEGKIAVNFEDINKAVEVEGDKVIFRLKIPYPPFLTILSQSWASIVDKEWCIEQGDWPGTAETWENYNNPETPPLQSIANGTGPFKLERWEPGVETVLIRNNDYWRSPAKIEKVIVKVVDEWSTRKLMFLAGDADIIYVPREHAPELENVSGIRIYKGLPQLAVDAIFFNFNIDPTSEDIGSGKLDGEGIPPNFFSDKDVRLGFAYSFDWETYIEDVFLGEAVQPASPIIEGLPFVNPAQEKYSLNLTKAEEHFRKAWNGEVWEKGFKLRILYNTGNIPRQTAAEMIKEHIEGLNPKFKVEVRGVEWPDYVRGLVRGKLTLFIIGWLADYPDPHNFVFPFMHSYGDFSNFQSYSNPVIDNLVNRGIRTLEPEQRRSIYYELQRLYHEDVPSVPTVQALGRHYERDWVKGWYYNPIFPNGTLGGYFYELRKGY